jgi:hypothetical protein
LRRHCICIIYSKDRIGRIAVELLEIYNVEIFIFEFFFRNFDF